MLLARLQFTVLLCFASAAASDHSAFSACAYLPSRLLSRDIDNIIFPSIRRHSQDRNTRATNLTPTRGPVFAAFRPSLRGGGHVHRPEQPPLLRCVSHEHGHRVRPSLGGEHRPPGAAALGGVSDGVFYKLTFLLTRRRVCVKDSRPASYKPKGARSLFFD